uniref:ERCC4 domain-containing protein EP364R n=1 Tax=Megaviridae environmental sample TaxID=1737588 RepID=A0A5J6VJN1_9VIRU|nr:MAG: ERCC4 domain protein [Megaviridae environmental sample]
MESNNITVVVDSREIHLLNLIHELQLDSNFEIKQLVLGDIQIQQDNQVLFIIERKTIRDLVSSYHDGRLIDQIDRIKKSGIPPSQVLFLLEGPWLRSRRQNTSKEEIIDIMMKIMLSAGFHVYHSTSKLETISILKMIYSSCCTHITLEGVEINRIAKCNNKTTHGVLASQLYAIPGVSQRIALEISKHFCNMEELINALKTQTVPDIIIPYKKPRPLNPKIITSICSYLIS